MLQVFCYALSPPDSSEWRTRIAGEVEHFTDVSSWSIPDIAARISADGIQVRRCFCWCCCCCLEVPEVLQQGCWSFGAALTVSAQEAAGANCATIHVVPAEIGPKLLSAVLSRWR